MGKPKPRRMADCHPNKPHHSLGLCEPCYKTKGRRNNPETGRAASNKSKRKRSLEDPKRFWLRRRLYGRLEHARKNGRPHDDIDPLFDFLLPLLPDVCPVLEISLDYSLFRGKGCGHTSNSPSIDRIDSDGGYTIGNVRVISDRANRLRNNGSLEELEKVIADMRIQRVFDDLEKTR